MLLSVVSSQFVDTVKCIQISPLAALLTWTTVILHSNTTKVVYVMFKPMISLDVLLSNTALYNIAFKFSNVWNFPLKLYQQKIKPQPTLF